MTQENPNVNVPAETANAIPQASPRRVKILETNYTEKNNLVEWKVQFEDGSQLILAIPGEELGALLGFEFILTPELIRQACKEFKGKEKLLIICSDSIVPDDIDKKLDDPPTEAVNKMLEQYPFKRVIENMHDGRVESLKNDLMQDMNSKLAELGCKSKIIKKDDIGGTKFAGAFGFVGIWRVKGTDYEYLTEEEVNSIFLIISDTSIKYGLIAERPSDFQKGFFILRQMK